MTDRVIVVRAGALYLPLIMAGAGALLRRPRRMAWVGALVSTLWILPTLWALQMVNLQTGWWAFAANGPAIHGMPVEMYLGWVLLWGAVPLLLFGGLQWWVRLLLLIVFDVLTMPLCAPVLLLSRKWLAGEVAALITVLLPALLLGEWTAKQRYVMRRVWMQVVMSGLIVLFLMPEVVFTLRGGTWPVHAAKPLLSIEVQIVLLLGVIGVAAAREFGERGKGTPIPFDPPRALVVSGPYRYVANPMQLSCVLVMCAITLLLRNRWMAAAAVCGVVYGVGLAAWDEGEDLEQRFGARWISYRREVHDWRLRWRPFVEAGVEPARLYVSETCGPCGEVRRWFAVRKVVGLEIVAAEDHPIIALHRVRYEDGEYAVDGVRAIARALEHTHLGWAFAGMVLSMPGLWWTVQTVLDGCGLGPRKIPWHNASCSTEPLKLADRHVKN